MPFLPLLLLAQALTLPPVPGADPARVAVPVAPPPIFVFFLPPPPTPLPLLTPDRPADLPPVLPESVRAVIAAAIDSGDAQAVAAVVRFAKTTNPETVEQVDRINEAYLARVAARDARLAREHRDALLTSGPLDFWKGEVELGASRSTGNTDALGIYAAANGVRDGIDWRHRLTGRIDFQRTNGLTTTERAVATYQPNYKLGERLYTYGLVQYERDRLLGYTTRLTGGGGLGYSILSGDALKLDLEGGPAFRWTDYVAEPQETGLAGRASMVLAWKLSSTLKLTQNAAAYFAPNGRNATSSTAIDTTLIGALKARLSYNVQYESDAPDGRTEVDTLSRATLVYSF